MRWWRKARERWGEDGLAEEMRAHRAMIEDRITATTEAALYQPRSLRHFISGVRIVETGQDEVRTETNFLIVESLIEQEPQILMVGRYLDRVVREEWPAMAHQHLDDLIAEGLPQRRKTFTSKVVDWSGEDLLSLHSAFREALEEINDRLVPVNEILHDLAFGPGRDRLRITLRSLGGREQDRFRQELKTLASNTTAHLSPDDIEERFGELQMFMARIRTVDDGGFTRNICSAYTG